MSIKFRLELELERRCSAPKCLALNLSAILDIIHLSTSDFSTLLMAGVSEIGLRSFSIDLGGRVLSVDSSAPRRIFSKGLTLFFG